MRVRDGLDDGETEPGAAVPTTRSFGGHPLKWLEEPIDLGLRYHGPSVDHPQHRPCPPVTVETSTDPPSTLWRIVAQVMGESLVQGLIGGGLGVGVGYLGAFVFTKLVPTVQADESPGGGSTPTFGGPPQTISGGASVSVGGSSSGVASHTFGNALKPVTVHMTAPLSLEILLVAIALAVAGGLIAGAVGGWQASRLRPAAALRRVE